MSKFSHFDHRGACRMVDVSGKRTSKRTARASGLVRMSVGTLRRIREEGSTKGDVLEVARLAGIMAAKRTAELIPLCHPLPLESAEVSFDFLDDRTIGIEAIVQVTARTGVEMEALTAVSVAALAIYDMCKSIDREIVVERVRLEEKAGGRSGRFVRKI
jgi:cyclic pyranopterin phosphate synthase